ncbi:MAG TPA: NTP transferase domain-containing protein [Sphingomicrobium sp.]|nr:NTP transferase domain-containing protein [Sphingomicrobium sp.]
MAVGALIGAYQEDDRGGLRALLPLSGRPLIEYQVRCASAAGTAPIVVVVERVPQALQDAFERLRLDGIGVFPVSDVEEAVSRFEAGATIMLIGDGIAPTAELVAQLADEPEPAVMTVPDDEVHEQYERIDGETRWAGVAVVDARLLGSTAAMLGDWDLQSTLLRRAIQEGARRMPAGEAAAEPILVERPEDLETFERRLLQGSRGTRTDWVSRYLLPPIEELATEQLVETSVKPVWLMWAALVLSIAAAACCLRGWLGAALVLMIASTPLDIVASRLATLRLRPFAARMVSRRVLGPAAGVPLMALAWWEMGHGHGWGTLIAGAGTIAFSEAMRIEKTGFPADADPWLFSRRSAIVAAIPFALAGAWTPYLVGLLLYAAASFFVVQHVRHSTQS